MRVLFGAGRHVSGVGRGMVGGVVVVVVVVEEEKEEAEAGV